MNVHSNTMHKAYKQNKGRNLSVNRLMDKQIMAYMSNDMIFSHK